MRSAFVDIIKTRGVLGLYSGLSPTLVEIIPYAGLQFGSYDTFKRSMMVMTLNLQFLHIYISGELLLCWINIPAKNTKYFYECWWNFVLLTVFYAMKAWNRYKYSHLNMGSEDDSVSSIQLFLCGFAAGTFSKAACHPLDVVKKRFQVIFLSWKQLVPPLALWYLDIGK